MRELLTRFNGTTRIVKEQRKISQENSLTHTHTQTQYKYIHRQTLRNRTVFGIENFVNTKFIQNVIWFVSFSFSAFKKYPHYSRCCTENWQHEELTNRQCKYHTSVDVDDIESFREIGRERNIDIRGPKRKSKE